jgi:hypothetical protein
VSNAAVLVCRHTEIRHLEPTEGHTVYTKEVEIERVESGAGEACCLANNVDLLLHYVRDSIEGNRGNVGIDQSIGLWINPANLIHERLLESQEGIFTVQENMRSFLAEGAIKLELPQVCVTSSRLVSTKGSRSIVDLLIAPKRIGRVRCVNTTDYLNTSRRIS